MPNLPVFQHKKMWMAEKEERMLKKAFGHSLLPLLGTTTKLLPSVSG